MCIQVKVIKAICFYDGEFTWRRNKCNMIVIIKVGNCQDLIEE